MALDFAAGCLGGCAGVLVGHPFDTVKVRLQTQSFTNPIYRGTFDCFASIIKTESVLGLFKGITSPLYGLAGINAVVFGMQANVQRRMRNPDKLSSHFVAGALAGFAQTFICSPMELAKTRMQVQGQGESRRQFKNVRHTYDGPVDCMRKIYHIEGIRGVFRGFWITALRETPSFGVYFVTFEYLCQCFKPDDPTKYVSTPALLMAGGLSGMASWLCTYPVDVVKSRVQADMKGQYNGFVDGFVKSYKQLGVAVFYRGLGSTLLRAFPVNAATFATVTWVLRFAKNHHISDDQTMDLSTYANLYHPPSAALHLPHLPNFPSHP